MTLTTTVTPDDIATELGQDIPVSGSVTERQWQVWIDDALMLISARATGLNITTVDQATLDYVIRQAVSDHAKRPDNATQVTYSVDDGSSSRTYRSGQGRVTILDEWWQMLGLNPVKSGAFETDTMPSDAGVFQDPALLWFPMGCEL